MMQVPPAGWSPERLAAFQELIDAIAAYRSFRDALAELAVNDATLNTRRTELGNHIKTVLGPRFRDAP